MSRKKASLVDYLKEAFLYRWNLLIFGGAAAAAVISGQPDVWLPLAGAAELLYLAGLTSMPKFQKAVDAKVHHQQRAQLGTGQAGSEAGTAQRRLAGVLGGLEPQAAARFHRLRRRCLEMRNIADGVRGDAKPGDEAHSLRTPGLDRLLWVFLRLLYSQQALQRFLGATDADAIERQIAELRGKEQTARDKGDERIVRAVIDSIATAELRLDNYRKAESNAEFAAVELDRIEGKIQALSEMAVNHQDPDYISSQVDSVADSMAHTEETIRDLQSITGLTDEMEGPPPILEAELEA